jgi:hypothetical protein
MLAIKDAGTELSTVVWPEKGKDVIRSMSARQLCKFLFINMLLLTDFVSLVEVTVNYFMFMDASDSIPSGALLTVMRSIYWRERDKNLIQYAEDCAQPQPLLGYTLRPGTCKFSGPEFSNTYHVNSLGLRDDEKSLNSPEVIVIGDSHAMGWGVEQQETFAQIIEARTGRVVLNGAVSSYGTVREMINLKRLNTDHLRALIIQYSDNDMYENNSFYRNNNRLQTMSPTQYMQISNAQEQMNEYYFGKHFRYIVSLYTDGLGKTLEWIRGRIADLARSAPSRLTMSRHSDSIGRPANSLPSLNEAELFLNVLAHSGVDLRGIEIIVFDISNYGRSGDRFFRLLQSSLSSKDRIFGSFNIKAIDVATLLGPQHYYRLDGHLNAKGHQVVANAVTKQMRLLRKPTSARAQ